MALFTEDGSETVPDCTKTICSRFWVPAHARSKAASMLEVKPGQIWKVRSHGEDTWRVVRVLNVILDTVELEYLEAPATSNFQKTLSADRYTMLTTASTYQFVAKEPTARKGAK